MTAYLPATHSSRKFFESRAEPDSSAAASGQFHADENHSHHSITIPCLTSPRRRQSVGEGRAMGRRQKGSTSVCSSTSGPGRVSAPACPSPTQPRRTCGKPCAATRRELSCPKKMSWSRWCIDLVRCSRGASCRLRRRLSVLMRIVPGPHSRSPRW